MYVGRGLRGYRRGMGQTCADGTAYVASFGCDDGSTPTCPSGYTLGNTGPAGSYSCVSSSGGASLIGVTAPSATSALCPIGQACNIIPGVANTYVYIGGGFLAVMLFIGVLKK